MGCQNRGFDGLDGAFSSRLAALFAEAPGHVWIKDGLRDYDCQVELYNQAVGKYGAGEAGRWAAVPGTSNHGHGLAADIGYADDATRQWVHANAHRFGLNFPMDHENWHIEPVGLRDGSFSAAGDAGHFHGGTGTGGSMDYSVVYPGMVSEQADGMMALEGMMQEQKHSGLLGELQHRMAMETAEETGEIMSGPDKGVLDEPVRMEEAPERFKPEEEWGAPSIQGETAGVPGGPSISGQSSAPAAPATGEGIQTAAQAAYNAGFRGDDLVTMLAVAGAESGWRTSAHNYNLSTGDDSWGLWQINVLPGANSQWAGDPRLTSADGNAQLAMELFRSSGFQPWSAWKNGMHHQYLDQSRTTLKSMGLI